MISSYVLEQGVERASGHVHSVFATSLNVELDGFLLHLGDARSPLSCCGASVAPGELGHLLARSRPGDRAIVKHGVLRVYDVAGVWDLDLGSFEVRSLSIAEPIDRAKLTTLEKAVASLELEERIGLERDARFEEVVRQLEQREPSVGELREAIGFLLGRGLGLTPSGDDLLVGYGIARWLLGSARTFAGTLLDELAGQTTDVSASYLRAMAAGYANEGYCTLAKAAAAGRVDRFPALLADLQRVGHTSGDDGLFGFWTGLHSVLSTRPGI